VRWLEDEPLGLYRDARDPERVDVDAIRRALTAEVRKRGRDETEHVALLLDRLGEQAHERIERVAVEARRAAEQRAEASSADRRARLAFRLALLLAGLAALLALVLLVSVVGPVRRLRAEVSRIASGDLAPPPEPLAAGRGELADLARDVEQMREQIRAATTHLESEVAKKTEHLSTALAERTRALEELDATKDRLVQAAKMAGLGTLAGGVAHEFNNLLGGILASIDNAKSAVKDTGVHEDLDLARRTARRAATLVEALLGVARPGQRALVPVDLAQVAADAVATARPAAAKRRVTLSHRGTAPLIVRGDEGQLHQVALNLITNALQAAPEGGHVGVRTEPAGRRGVLEVSDDGPGIAPAARARLFEPFFTTREGGTGLGLFVSYGIVERHGGTIEAADASPRGARFTVTLPAA
jgi:two-component system NtrC family sensor kinase